MKKKIIFTTAIMVFSVLLTACKTTAPFTFTDTFNISTRHFLEIQGGPWENIDNTFYRIILDHEEKIINVIGCESNKEDKENNKNFRTKKPAEDWFPGAEGKIKIHAGFFIRYESVRSVLLDTLYEYPDYAVRVSGFSLGGTWTQLFLLDIIQIWPDRDVQAIFYAPANPWRKLPRKYQKELEQRTIFVRSYWDPITWMRLIWFYRYGHNITIGKWWRIFPSQHEHPQIIRALDEFSD